MQIQNMKMHGRFQYKILSCRGLVAKQKGKNESPDEFKEDLIYQRRIDIAYVRSCIEFCCPCAVILQGVQCVVYTRRDQHIYNDIQNDAHNREAFNVH